MFLELLALCNRVLGQTTNWVAANKKLADFDKLLRAEMRVGIKFDEGCDGGCATSRPDLHGGSG